MKSNIPLIILYMMIAWKLKFSASVSLFNGISTLHGWFNTNTILANKELWHYLIHKGEGGSCLSKGYKSKVNAIAQLEFKFA